jgi:hypothetical protein
MTAGGALPAARLDIRLVAKDFVGGKVGTLASCRERVAPEGGRPPIGPGRAGRKLAALADVLAAILGAAAAARLAR